MENENAHENTDSGLNGWQPVETAPYETPVLTYWPGGPKRNPVMLINTKNSGTMMGKRDGWWHSKPDQMPTHWRPLPAPPGQAG